MSYLNFDEERSDINLTKPGEKNFESPIMTNQNTETISKQLYYEARKLKQPCAYTSDGISNDAT